MIRNNFHFILFSFARQVRSLLKNKTKHSPLTFEQIRAIGYISRLEGLSQKELSELLETKTMATSKLIDVLEQLKMVRREKCHNDGRSYQLFLSEAGHEEANKISKISNQVFQILTTNISEKEMASFNGTIIKMQKNIEQFINKS